MAEITPMLSDLRMFTSHEHRIITTCLDASASVNRNYGLSLSEADVVIMIDDDISGFYDEWVEKLIKPLDDSGIVFVSARLVRKDGRPATMVNRSNDYTSPIVTVESAPTAACAFRWTATRFCEEYRGSGFEDTHFIKELQRDVGGRVVVNNRCKLIHANEMKNQIKNFDHNYAVFHRYWG
jgi:glycosyltransferase involved in cell wall biosynthesis